MAAPPPSPPPSSPPVSLPPPPLLTSSSSPQQSPPSDSTPHSSPCLQPPEIVDATTLQHLALPPLKNEVPWSPETVQLTAPATGGSSSSQEQSITASETDQVIPMGRLQLPLPKDGTPRPPSMDASPSSKNQAFLFSPPAMRASTMQHLVIKNEVAWRPETVQLIPPAIRGISSLPTAAQNITGSETEQGIPMRRLQPPLPMEHQGRRRPWMSAHHPRIKHLLPRHRRWGLLPYNQSPRHPKFSNIDHSCRPYPRYHRRPDRLGCSKTYLRPKTTTTNCSSRRRRRQRHHRPRTNWSCHLLGLRPPPPRPFQSMMMILC